MDIDSVSDFRKAMRHGPYAWPGGYPCYFITADGAALSFEAVREERRQVLYSLMHGLRNSGWRVVAMAINYEDEDLICEHTGKLIECAYGD